MRFKVFLGQYFICGRNPKMFQHLFFLFEGKKMEEARAEGRKSGGRKSGGRKSGGRKSGGERAEEKQS
jgi:hypothetical protein